MIALRIQSPGLTELAAQAAAIGAGAELLRAAGDGVAVLLRKHFIGLEKTRPNRLGGARTHFYGKVQASVQQPVVSGNAADVSIDRVGIAQRYFGGPIEAGHGISSKTGKPTEFLTVPARAETHGKTAKAFPHLEFRPTRRGGMLVEMLRTVSRITRAGRRRVSIVGGLVMFWLVRRLVQKPDPTVLPTDADLLQAAETSAAGWLQRRLEEGPK
mgnify:CR=1 FL=1